MWPNTPVQPASYIPEMLRGMSGLAPTNANMGPQLLRVAPAMAAGVGPAAVGALGTAALAAGAAGVIGANSKLMGQRPIDLLAELERNPDPRVQALAARERARLTPVTADRLAQAVGGKPGRYGVDKAPAGWAEQVMAEQVMAEARSAAEAAARKQREAGGAGGARPTGGTDLFDAIRKGYEGIPGPSPSALAREEHGALLEAAKKIPTRDKSTDLAAAMGAIGAATAPSARRGEIGGVPVLYGLSEVLPQALAKGAAASDAARDRQYTQALEAYKLGLTPLELAATLKQKDLDVGTQYAAAVRADMASKLDKQLDVLAKQSEAAYRKEHGKALLQTAAAAGARADGRQNLKVPDAKEIELFQNMEMALLDKSKKEGKPLKPEEARREIARQATGMGYLYGVADTGALSTAVAKVYEK